MHALFDLGGGLAGRVHRDLQRIGQVAVGQLFHQLRHGGREQQRLAFARQHLGDAAQRVDETDVQHLVGLVQHQVFGLRQVHGAALDQVDQPAGRRDQHVHTALHAHGLGIDRGAADDAELPDGGASGIGVDIGGDLGRQFARRRQDQRTAGARLGLAADVQKPRQHRQTEGRRLAGAGLGKAQQVAALDDARDGLFLDRRGGVDAHRRQVHRHAGVDAHAGEGGVDVRDGPADEFLLGLVAVAAMVDRGLGVAEGGLAALATRAGVGATGLRFARTGRASGFLRHVIFRPGHQPYRRARRGATRHGAAGYEGAGHYGTRLPPRVNGKRKIEPNLDARCVGCSRGSGWLPGGYEAA